MPKKRAAQVAKKAKSLLPLTSASACTAFFKVPRDAPEAELERASAEALEQDPHAVEVLFSLGNRAKDGMKRREYFFRASEAAKHKPRRTVADWMPSYRLRMAELLMHDGQLSDAAELLTPALIEDPRDESGVHMNLVDLLLRLGWDEELQSLVEGFRGCSPPVAFAEAILEYRRHGATSKATHLLEQADREYPGVACVLCALIPQPLEQMSFEKSPLFYVASLLLPGVRDTAGAIKWIRETLSQSMRAFLDEFEPRDSWRRLLESAKKLAQKRTIWDLAVAQRTVNEKTLWLAVVMKSAELLQIETFSQEPTKSELEQLLLLAVTEPGSGQPHRPSKLRVTTTAHRAALTQLCIQLSTMIDVARPKETMIKLMEQAAQRIGSADAHGDQVIHASDRPIGELPRSDDIWLLGSFQPPMFITDRPTPYRTWLIPIVSEDDGRIMHISAVENQPTPEGLWQTLCNIMLHPDKGSPRRPQRVVVEPSCWSEQFSRYDEEVVFERGDAHVSDYYTRMIAGMLEFQGPVKPALRDQVGVDDDLLASFYQTAASFYRASPWKMVGGDRFFEMRCDAWKNPRWAACIIGQLGQERGMTVYDNPDDALAFLHASNRKLSKLNSAVVHFSEAHECIPVDVWNIERCGWETAGFEAIPFVARVKSGSSIIAASADDLLVLMAAMQHSIQFLDHPAADQFTVDHNGDKLHMRWLN